MNTIYITVLFLYILLVTLAAFFFRKQSDSGTFWTEGRSISGVRAGISLSATFMSISWSVVYGIEVFLQHGSAGFFILSLPWIIVLSVFFVLAPRLRNITVFSQPELIGKHFGKRAGKLSALPILFVFIIWGGAEMDVAASLLSSVTGISQIWLLVIIFLTISVYMSLNGTHAVILTDVIQYLLVAVFFLIIFIAGYSENTVNTNLMTLNVQKIDFLFIFLTFLAYLPGWLAETDIWIRLQVTKNAREARTAMAIAILNAVVFVFLFPLLVASVIKNGVAGGLEGVTTLLALIQNPWVAGFAAVGLIAASMSTIDTCTNVSAMTVSYDLTEQHSQKFNLLSVWIAGGASLLFAMVSDSLKDAFYLSSALLSTSLFIPVMACFVAPRNPISVKAVLMSGPPITICFYILEKYKILYMEQGGGISYILFSLIAVAMLYLGINFKKSDTLYD